MHKKGIALTTVTPAFETDEKLFRAALDVVENCDIDTIEFYTNDQLAPAYGNAVRNSGFESVFVSALDQKRNPLCNISSVDEAQRRNSVDLTKRSLEKAQKTGTTRAVIQSGRAPEDQTLEVVAMDSLMRSFEELSAFAGNALTLSLEPCDRAVEIRQLCGPTLQLYTMMKSLRLPYNNLELTMDIAHIAELLEDPLEAIRLCKPFSNHVHLANCVLDVHSPLFGDKHPDFTVEAGRFSTKDAIGIYNQVKELYRDEALLTTFEVIAHEKEPMDCLHSVIDRAGWFFQKKPG